MRVISRYITTILVVLMALNACEKPERILYNNEDGRYVRFNLQLNNDLQPVNPNELSPEAYVYEEYSHENIKEIKVPVAITSEPLDEEVIVEFSSEVIGEYDGFTIEPENFLTFKGIQLQDTITIAFNERWSIDSLTQIVLKIESISDPDIQIGTLEKEPKNTELTINLADVVLRYSFPTTNMLEISGKAGDQVSIPVEFPDGFFKEELEGMDLIFDENPGFEYSLELLPFSQGDEAIYYRLTLLEDLDDTFYFYTSLQINDNEYYTVAGNAKFTISKPENIYRDKEVFTAQHFYNLSDAFYRLYGKTWMDYNNDGECDWTKFNTFTFPVEVPKEHPNAVLFDDNGTADTSDDVYHHAFRVGFNSPNLGRTTNSFNLKRLFENEYGDADKSPGFNIPQALEFYPEDGTSTTKGTVRIIPQDIILSNKTDKAYTIFLEGEGTYEEVSPGIFLLKFGMKLSNNELFGGTIEVPQVMYNTSNDFDLENLTEDCYQQIDL